MLFLVYARDSQTEYFIINILPVIIFFILTTLAIMICFYYKLLVHLTLLLSIIKFFIQCSILPRRVEGIYKEYIQTTYTSQI
jgi:hypothetical protein